MSSYFKKEKKLSIIFIITIVFIITNLAVIYFIFKESEKKIIEEIFVINDIFVEEKEILEIEDEKLDINFEHPENWFLVEDTQTHTDVLMAPFTKHGVLLYPPDEEVMIIINKAFVKEDEIFNLDEIQAEFLDIFVNDPDYTLIKNTVNEIDSLEAKNAVFTYKEQEDILKIRQVITEQLNNYYYNFIFLTTKENYEKFLLDFDLILKTVKFNEL